MASLANVFYLRTLGKAYAHSDFLAAYAIVRSTVPAILFLSGMLAFSEPGRLGAFIGLAAVVISILIFAMPRD